MQPQKIISNNPRFPQMIALRFRERVRQRLARFNQRGDRLLDVGNRTPGPVFDGSIVALIEIQCSDGRVRVSFDLATSRYTFNPVKADRSILGHAPA